MRIFWVLAWVSLATTFAAKAAVPPCDDSRKHCAFVLLKQSTGEQSVFNELQAKKRLTPFSTFKVPNTLIALHFGVVEKASSKMVFDEKRYPKQKWWPEAWTSQPHTLRSAFQESVLPIYRGIAREIGESRMLVMLQQWGYGNKNISSGIDKFWLNGSLRISAIEQTQVLQTIWLRHNRFSPNAFASFKEVMQVEESSNYILYAKTGGGPLGKGKALGWYVGVVELEDDIAYFALNIIGKSFSEIKKSRIDIARKHLKLAGVLR